MNNTLYDSVAKAGLPVTHVCEVGVYLPETSNVLGWVYEGIRTTLVECDPIIVRTLKEHFGNHPHVSTIDVAVANEPGTLTLYRTGASTFGSNVSASPAQINDGYRPDDKDAFTARAVTFDSIDDGSIDILSIDIEGGEWNVLRHMISRPQIISIETHGKRYVNPFKAEIEQWMRDNGYGTWYTDATDTVYRKGWKDPSVDRSPRTSLWKQIKKLIRGY
ncbi:MAG: FkbM family methyltransferase [Candidatus Kapabacteria bacterium]|nr:FkbM family methyltransferase [Candidatus Kapabacteria bacterium]